MSVLRVQMKRDGDGPLRAYYQETSPGRVIGAFNVDKEALTQAFGAIPDKLIMTILPEGMEIEAG